MLFMKKLLKRVLSKQKSDCSQALGYNARIIIHASLMSINTTQ